MRDEKLLYFASSDGGIDHKLNSGDFETSLIYNVLFGSSALVMPDVFFFNCNPLLTHMELQAGRMPFFLAALRSGLVVPAFRSADVQSFRESLDQLELLKVRGAEAQRFNLAAVATTLDANVPRDVQPALWRENLGGHFEQMMDRVFAASGEAIQDDETRRMWTLIEEWRVEGLAGAKRLTLEQGGTGLRRAEMWNALGHHLGLIPEDSAYHKPVDLIEDVTRNRGVEAGRKASFLVDVVNLCYQHNQANGLLRAERPSEPNIPGVLSQAGRAVIEYIDPTGPWRRPDRVFEHTVRVPKVKTLLNAKGVELLAVRDGSAGASYRTHRDRWAEDPSDDNAELLRAAIDKYAAEIKRQARGEQERTKFALVANGARMTGAAAVGAGIRQLGFLVETHPGYALVAGLAGAGAAAAAIVKNASFSTTEKRRLEIPRFGPEYNLGPGPGAGLA
ncbi:hypothetical protein ACFWHL_05365 [Streptomyces massasporeus]